MSIYRDRSIFFRFHMRLNFNWFHYLWHSWLSRSLLSYKGMRCIVIEWQSRNGTLEFTLIFRCNESYFWCIIKLRFSTLIRSWLSIPFYESFFKFNRVTIIYQYIIYFSLIYINDDIIMNKKYIFLYVRCMFNYWLFIRWFSPANTYVFITQRWNTWRANENKRARERERKRRREE